MKNINTDKKFLLRNYLIKLSLIIISISLLIIFAGTKFPFEQYKYVGVTKCVSSCHRTENQGRQLEIWKNSKHSNAWKTLKTEDAKKIAIKSGYNISPTEIPECVRCHLLGKDIIPEELSVTFEKDEGVQCESCHGAGSGYMKMSVMKDLKKSIENGLIVYENKEELCLNCHNESSPTYRYFNLSDSWEKIKHYKP